MTKDKMFALLDEMKRTAGHASLTRSLKGGVKPMAEIYNRCLEALKAEGDQEVGTVFPLLDPETTTVDEVGVYAALLSRYIRPRTEPVLHRNSCDEHADED